jgi:hypothetical protein
MQVHYLAVHLSSEFPVFPLDATSYIQEFRGEIYAKRNKDDLVGKFVCQFVNVHSALDDGVNIKSVFESGSNEVAEYYPALYGNGGEQRPFFTSDKWEGDWVDGANLLIVSKLGILPKYRKKGYGLIVLKSLESRIATLHSVVGLNPIPLQYSPDIDNDPWKQELELHELPMDRKEYHRKKLETYFAKLRFVKIPKTDVMLISTAMRLPSYEDLLVKCRDDL